MPHQWQWFPGIPGISSFFGLAWEFNLKNRRQGRKERQCPSIPHPTASSFLCWLLAPRIFFIPESKHCPGLNGAEDFMFLSSWAVQENHHPARCPGKLFSAFPWQALSEPSAITDHRLVMERSASDMLHLTRRRGSAKHIKSWKITGLNNTSLYLFFPSWFSLWSERSPEATLSSVINGEKCWSQFYKSNYFLQKSVWN